MTHSDFKQALISTIVSNLSVSHEPMMACDFGWPFSFHTHIWIHRMIRYLFDCISIYCLFMDEVRPAIVSVSHVWDRFAQVCDAKIEPAITLPMLLLCYLLQCRFHGHQRLLVSPDRQCCRGRWSPGVQMIVVNPWPMDYLLYIHRSLYFLQEIISGSHYSTDAYGYVSAQILLTPNSVHIAPANGTFIGISYETKLGWRFVGTELLHVGGCFVLSTSQICMLGKFMRV